MTSKTTDQAGEANLNTNIRKDRLLWGEWVKALALIWIFFNHLSELYFGYPFISNPDINWPPFWERVAQLVPLTNYGIWNLPVNLLRYFGWFDEGLHLHVPKTLVQYGVYADISSDGFRYYGPTIGVGPIANFGEITSRAVCLGALIPALVYGFFISLPRKRNGQKWAEIYPFEELTGEYKLIQIFGY